MRSWGLHTGGDSYRSLPGDTLVDAITNNFDVIASEAGVGNAAGYRLVSVRAELARGWPGVEVAIVAYGQDLAHQAALTGPKTTVVRIRATPEDLPEPVDIQINRP